jgi:hypothetical protein
MFPHTIIYGFLDILRNALFITGLVATILLLIEYLGALLTQNGKLLSGKSAMVQIAAAALLGVIPGCVGGLAVVSLYVQGAVGIGALTAAFIATMGDEALAMFSLFPRQALILQAILLAVAIPIGLCVNKCCKNITFVKKLRLDNSHTHYCTHHINGNIWQNIRNMTLRRALLVVGLAIFIVAICSGHIAHSHTHSGHSHEIAHNFFWNEEWINWLFAVLATCVLVVVLSTEKHFLDEHLWRHVIRRHLVKIFLWTLAALSVVALLDHYIEAQTWISRNPYSMLVAALVLGIIPSSGPHLVFVVLFVNGSVGFPILFANMLVQDGHAGLPLLAYSKRMFMSVKILKMTIAATIAGLWLIW